MTAMLAYVPPAVTLVAAAAGFALAARGLSAWRAAALLLGAASLAQIAADNPRLVAPPPPAAAGLVVLYWNVGREPRVASVLPALAEGADGTTIARHVSGAWWPSDHRWQRVVVRPPSNRPRSACAAGPARETLSP